MGASAAVCGLGHPAAARAADVLVLGRDGHVTVRREPYLITVTVTPPPVGLARSPNVRAHVASASAVRAQLAHLERIHAISSTAYQRYLASFQRALRAARALRGTRAAELQAVIANIHDFAAAGLLSASRLRPLFLTLNRNVQWWTTGPIPAPGQVVSFAGSQIDWEYYAGQGLEIQVLASFFKADWLFNNHHHGHGRALLGELIPLAARRAGGLTWEYYFNFDGGAPPWTSAMSQGTALQALADGYRATGDGSYLAVGRRALPVLTTNPSTGVAVRTARGLRFVQYSFDPSPADEVINAFLQAVIGLNDFANLSGDPLAEELFVEGNAEAEHEVPYFDTGSWSLYQPGVPDTISYHKIVTGFLEQLCSITHASSTALPLPTSAPTSRTPRPAWLRDRGLRHPHTADPRRMRTSRSSETRPRCTSATFLQAGDEIRVPRPHAFTYSYDGNTFTVKHADVTLQCRNVLLYPGSKHARTMLLALTVNYGRAVVRSGIRPRRALVVSDEMLAFATEPGTNFIVQRDPHARSTRAWTLNHPIVAAKTYDQSLRINSRITYTAISDAKGLRLDIWPFSISPLQRRTTPVDGLPAYWADGLSCSVGCTAPGAIAGWPLAPFHQQHAIRAGINELRPANFHVAVDIEAHNFQPVYAIQSGYASIRYAGTGDVNVDVGNFYYWHINPTVSNGQYVAAYKTVIGNVLYGFYHVAFSEVDGGRYLNPLRPGGSLRPYGNTEPPIIGVPKIFSDGRVIVGAFEPQSFVATGFPYETPVLAPSSLAWRLYDAHGRALTGLEWAMRGSQNYPPALKPVIFAPGAIEPGVPVLLHPAPVHPQLGLLARGRADTAAAAVEPGAGSLPADGLCVGLGRQHLGARLLVQDPTGRCGKRAERRVRAAQRPVRLRRDGSTRCAARLGCSRSPSRSWWPCSRRSPAPCRRRPATGPATRPTPRVRRCPTPPRAAPRRSLPRCRRAGCWASGSWWA